MFTKTDHILGQETNLNKLKRIKIMQSMFSDYNGMKLKLKTKRNVNELARSLHGASSLAEEARERRRLGLPFIC